MVIKFKKLDKKAVTPSYSYPNDAGLDLTAINIEHNNDIHVYKTGISIEIPIGYVGLLFPRSSVYSKSIILSNCVGVIDSGYRGEIIFKYRNLKVDNHNQIYNIGDKVGQLIILPYPKINLEEVNELSKSSRGMQGFGSSDSNTLLKIIDFISDLEKIDKSELLGNNRKISLSRHICVYLIYKMTNTRLVNISTLFNKHHSTILNSIKVINNLLDVNKKFRLKIEDIESKAIKYLSDSL